MRTIILTLCLLLMVVPIYGQTGTYGYNTTSKLMVPSDTTVRGATVSAGTVTATNTMTVAGNRVARTGDTLTGDATATIEADGSTAVIIPASFTRDAEWDTEAEVETAWGGVNILLETDIDTQAEFEALLFTLPSGGSAHTIEEEGSALTQRGTLNFVGGGVTATDDAGNTETDVTITRSGIVREMWLDAAQFNAYYTAPALYQNIDLAGGEDVWLFDQTSPQNIVVRFAIPKPWDLGDVKIKIYWSTFGDDADGGDVRWQASMFSAENNESMALASSAPTVDDAQVANDQTVVTITDAMTMTSTARVSDADAVLEILISRLAGLAQDTLASDVYFWGAKIQWTESSTEPTAW